MRRRALDEAHEGASDVESTGRRVATSRISVDALLAESEDDHTTHIDATSRRDATLDALGASEPDNLGPSDPDGTQARTYQPSELEDLHAVFLLIDRPRAGTLPTDALLPLLALAQLPTNAVADACTIVGFQLLVGELAHHPETPSSKRGSPGMVLLAILESVRRRSMDVQDFKLAQQAKKMSDSIRDREEARRLNEMAVRHATEGETVRRAHEIQSMEFNSAWSQTMDEFERQAAEQEEELRGKLALEFDERREKALAAVKRLHKYSRELIGLKTSVETLAKQGKLEEAHAMKRKAQQLERYEKVKLENEQEVQLATKELAIRQQQRVRLDSFQRRIDRGREEHKEQWIQGAQRLLQTHRNMLTDLKRKQALETSRIETAVKMELAAVTRGGAKSVKESARPRVDSGKRKPVAVKPKALAPSRSNATVTTR